MDAQNPPKKFLTFETFVRQRAEIDILVSKLLGFETFAKSLRVSVSVSENLVSEKKSRLRFRKSLVSEKNFILVTRCQAKSNISLINSTVVNNKKHVIFNIIVFVIVCFLSQRKCPYLNAFAECLLLNNVI